MNNETMAEILRKAADCLDKGAFVGEGSNSEMVADCNGLNEDDEWLSQLVSLITGEVAHYMSQGMDYLWVDCGPWHILYDKTKGEDNESE